MKRIILSVLVLMSPLLLAGCAAMRAANVASGRKTLTIEPSKIVYRGVEGDRLRFELPLVFQNHTKGTASVRQIKIRASIAGKQVFTSSCDEELTIASDSERQLPVAVDIELGNIAKGVLEGSPLFAFHAEAVVDLGVLGKRIICSENERRIFSPTRPRLSLTNISLRKSDRAALRLQMSFDRTEDPDDKIIRSSFSGSALVCGISVGSFSQVRDSEKVEAEVVMPTKAALSVTKQIATTRKLSAKVTVMYEADTETMQYRIPYVFERDDISFRRKEKRIGPEK